MRLAFLMERVYAPYAKWFGTAFRKLACATALTPLLETVVATSAWPVREAALVQVYEILAKMHNELGITAPCSANVARFHDRPFLVIGLNGFAQTLLESIKDEAVQAIAAHGPLGGIDQLSDNTNVLTDGSLHPMVRSFYAAADDAGSDRMIPIEGWEFHDYSRVFAVRWGPATYRFDGSFDESLDAYPDVYRVYRVEAADALGGEATLVGAVRICAQDFDDTRRRYVRDAIVRAGIGTGGGVP